ncbi:MAG: bifunctional hydroxymethylpyrimidine kinase/phosphomethylpyrimidine kinase [Alistipes sp.]|nr:bifunctional hydroxymethylpyrimidine kinase/phosphomethylpyrimidine kinase [Alistipes sp.]
MFYIPVMTIAGSDSGGGAGIQADVKTFSALGCFATSVITAVTAQNTLGVSAIEQLSPEIISSQIRAVMDDIQPRYIKIGMVSDSTSIDVVATTLSGYALDGLVLDPVMVATSGDRLMREDAVSILKERLIPLSTLLTPNIPEAEVLSGQKITLPEDMPCVARRILEYGCKGVLIKGGHLEGVTKQDYLLYKDADGNLLERLFSFNTINTPNTHGTGCTLSSAITAFLAHGYELEQAVMCGREYLHQALISGQDVTLGRGHGPVNHFFNPQKLVKNA